MRHNGPLGFPRKKPTIAFKDISGESDGHFLFRLHNPMRKQEGANCFLRILSLHVRISVYFPGVFFAQQTKETVIKWPLCILRLIKYFFDPALNKEGRCLNSTVSSRKARRNHSKPFQGQAKKCRNQALACGFSWSYSLLGPPWLGTPARPATPA